MGKRSGSALTELEGAALMVVGRFGRCTPYRVRLDFLTSSSHEWSGSAGAVYPALRRLEAAGFLKATRKATGRNSVHYSLTHAGRTALTHWLVDVDRAAGSGLDPFRCRADSWAALPARIRVKLSRRLIAALSTKCAEITRILRDGEDAEPQALQLELALHKSRLQWLKSNAGPV